MTQSSSLQMDPKTIIGRALRNEETLMPLRSLVSLINTEIEEEAVGYFILNSCYTKNYKDSLLSYEDDSDDKKRLEAMRMGPAKRVPWLNNICLARFDTNWEPCDGIRVVNIEDNEGILISNSPKYTDDETFDVPEVLAELPDRWISNGKCPKLYTYGDAFIFRNKEPKIIDTRFLLRALTSDEVTQQVERFGVENGKMVGLDENDFLSLLIPVPRMQEQIFMLELDGKKVDKADFESVVGHYLGERTRFVLPKQAKMELMSALYSFVGGNDSEVIKTLPSFVEGVLSETESMVLKCCTKEVSECLFSERFAYPSREDDIDVPRELSDFMFGLLDVGNDENPTVYNPYPLYGSLANHRARFEGEEVVATAWAMTKARLFIAGVENDIKLGNPLSGDGKKYGYIICNPPCGMGRIDEINPIISMLYNRLETGGRLVLSVPMSYLMAPDRHLYVKNRLVKEGAISNVFVMPSGLFGLQTNTSYAVLVIVKEGKKCGLDSVLMMDCTNMFEIDLIPGRSRTRFICKDAEAALASFRSSEYELNCVEMPFSQIEANCSGLFYNLNPLGYLAEIRVKNKMPNANLVKLGELVEPLQGYTPNRSNRREMLDGKIRIVTASDLSDENSDLKLDYRVLNEMEGMRGMHRLIDSDSLLVSKVGRETKAVCYAPCDGVMVAYRSDQILAYRLIDDRVSLEYIASELSCADYVQEQMAMKMVGHSVPYRRREDMRGILIEVPDKEQQKNRIMSNKVQLMKKSLGQKGTEYFEKLKRQHDDYVLCMRNRKHAIGNVLGDVVPALDGLLDYFERHESVGKTEVVWEGYDDTVGSVLTKLKNELRRINNMVDNMTKDVDVSYGEAEGLQVKKLIESYIKGQIFSNWKMNLNFQQELFDEAFGRRCSVRIKVCKEDFFKILDNIVNNAIKYGFKEEGKDYRIVVDVRPTEKAGYPAVEIAIKNNGAPLPKGMTTEKVFQWGKTSSDSTGIGGWYIKDAVEHFGGEVRLDAYLPENNEFPVEYVMKFPMVDF